MRRIAIIAAAAAACALAGAGPAAAAGTPQNSTFTFLVSCPNMAPFLVTSPSVHAASGVGTPVVVLPIGSLNGQMPGNLVMTCSYTNVATGQTGEEPTLIAPRHPLTSGDVLRPGSKEEAMTSRFTRWPRGIALAALIAGLAAAGSTAVPAKADGVTPAQLKKAGWTCIQPHIDPTLLLCAPPGQGLPPLPGTPGFADRAPSYEFMVFEFATGAFLGHDHLLRPDIYEQGKPPCPQQPGGQYTYNPRNDLWSCLRT